MNGREPIVSDGSTPVGSMDRLSTGRKAAFVGGTLLALVMIWLLGLELAIRVFDIGPEINPVWSGNYQLSQNPALRYELAPGSSDGRSKINTHGMRDREYPLDKPPGTFRIAVIGDSIAFGNSISESSTFSTQLEALFAKYFRESGEPIVEVLNFGVTGYSISQVVETLRSRALAFDPDLVVYAYALNDPQEYSLEMDQLLAQLTEAEERYLVLDGPKNFLQRWRLYRLTRYLLNQGSAGRRAAPVWHEDDPQFLALREGRFAEYFAEIHTAPETWQPIESGLDELERLAEQHDFGVHAIVFPLLTDLERYPISEVHAQLRNAFAAHSIPALDLLDEFACFASTRGAKLAADALHPNKTGHALTAVALLRHLLATNAVPDISETASSRLLSAAPDTADYFTLTKEVDRLRSGEVSKCRAGSS
jgi:lysophospholipase L1-like esterase